MLWENINKASIRLSGSFMRKSTISNNYKNEPQKTFNSHRASTDHDYINPLTEREITP